MIAPTFCTRCGTRHQPDRRHRWIRGELRRAARLAVGWIRRRRR